MKLFSDLIKHEEHKSTGESTKRNKIIDGTISIVSARRDILDEVRSQLYRYNLKSIVEVDSCIFNLKESGKLALTGSLIIDIGMETCIDKIVDMVNIMIPASTKFLLLGDCDSISFSQALTKKGINYLHIGSQLASIYAQLCNYGDVSFKKTDSLKISIIGCKGGTGTSTIAYRAFKAASKMVSVPVLLVQGGEGSQDLDILSGSPVVKDGSIVEINQNEYVRIETSDSLWVYDDVNYRRFNMVFFDHAIYGQNADRIETVITESNTVILIVTRELASIRVAKKTIEESKRILLTKNELNPKIFLFLNDCRPKRAGDIRVEDIEEYLGRKIDIIRTYQNSNKENDTIITDFVSSILGKSTNKKANFIKKLSWKKTF